MYGPTHQLPHARSIPRRMDEGEAHKPPAIPGHDASDNPIGDGIVGMERGEEHGTFDACLIRAFKVAIERGAGIPGAGKTIAQTGMAMTIDDHRMSAHSRPSSIRRPKPEPVVQLAPD
jgi:hypothetical protein